MAMPTSDNFSNANSPGERQKIPKIGADAKAIREYVDRGAYYLHRLRAYDWSRWRRAELYDQGFQHLNPAASQLDGAGTYSQWARKVANPNSPNYIPLPVINEGQGIRANESARLGRPNYRPKIIPREDTLQARLGAKAAQDALESRNRDMDWANQAQLMYYHQPLYGGVWLKSEWVNSWDKTTMVPAPDAVACPNHNPLDPNSCPTVLASPKIPAEQARTFGQNAQPAPQDASGAPPGLKATNCPTCDGGPPLLPFKASMDEAHNSKDMLGQPLGKAQPLGDWVLSVRSPYDMFPRNLGLDMRSGQVDEWVEIHVENLDWIANRYPEKSKDVKPESPTMLAQIHPVAGAPDFYGGLDTNLFKDCVRVKEKHKMPWMELQDDGITLQMNKGRSIVMAGDTVLMDGPLMIESLTKPGEWIPRAKIDYIPWEMKDGGRRLSGFGIWDLMFDPQDGLNECVSQEQSTRQRMAVPFYVSSRANNWELSADEDGVPGRRYEIDIDPISPEFRPYVLNDQTAPPGVAQEADYYTQALPRIAGQAQVEKGETPPNVSAALAIQSLKEYASETREGRLERIKITLKRMWSHGLQLMCAMYIEPRPVRSTDDDGEERWRMLQADDLKNQTEVEIETDPDFDEKAKNQQQVSDFIQNGLINVQTLTPSDRRRIIRIYDPPKALTEIEDLQVNAAQREWVNFRDKKTIPIINPALDDHAVHREEHARDMNTERFRKMCADARFYEDVLPILGPTWNELLQQAQMTPAQPMTPQVDPTTGQPIPSGPPTQDPNTGAIIPAPPVMVPAGPPSDLQKRIVMVWTQALAMGKQMQGPAAAMTPPGDPQALAMVMQYYAHEEAHKLLMQGTQQAVESGAPVAAAPGSANVQGMAPTPQEMPMASAGAGV